MQGLQKGGKGGVVIYVEFFFLSGTPQMGPFSRSPENK